MVALIVVVVVIVLLVVALWLAFNGLIKKRNRTREAWSEIDVEESAAMTSFPTS